MSDQVLFRQSLAAVLREEGYQISDQTTTASLRHKSPDVALLDLSHVVSDAMLLVDDLHDQLPESQIVLMGSPTRLAASIDGHDDAELEFPRSDIAALLRMIEGRTSTTSSELSRAHKQWLHVTARQRDVLRWLAHGLDNPGIAAKLRVGTRAIKAHISALLAMFGLDSRTQLALLACNGGLMPPTKA
ncbi:MAG: LuxR C-terminal-related transcriptional regulator [Myxococcota bacterium]|nr:LuxR C-terminal-related transcriptional regulator [Myxococcota bacterium]